MELIEMWRMRPELLRYAASLAGRSADAEDVVQTAYLRAAEHAEALRERSPELCRAWLYKTVKNAFLDQCRRSRRQVLTETDAERIWEDDLTALEVGDVLGKLPRGMADIVRMRHLEGMTSQEIAEEQGIPAATVRTRLRAAVMLLKKWKGEGKI